MKRTVQCPGCGRREQYELDSEVASWVMAGAAGMPSLFLARLLGRFGKDPERRELVLTCPRCQKDFIVEMTEP